MKKITLLGATGSIGQNALEVIRNNSDKLKLFAATANKSFEKLIAIVDEFEPEYAIISEKPENFSHNGKTKWLFGRQALLDICKENVDMVLNSLVGGAGLEPSYYSLLSGNDLALANKESFVMAGDLLTKLAEKNNLKILPVDSEHSALFQLIGERDYSEVNKIILTASGGPFRDFSKEALKNVTVKDALNHPTWAMGEKITIDSATLMNKGFEVIEAKWFFEKDFKDIDVIIHPQSIVHSFIELCDGAFLGHLGLPDMKIPIQFALSYPERWDFIEKKPFYSKIRTLTFEEPDFEKFPCLRLAYEAGEEAGTMPTVLNRANEEAVYAFLAGKIAFTDIALLIEKFMNLHKKENLESIEQIIEIDNSVKEEIKKIIKEW